MTVVKRAFQPVLSFVSSAHEKYQEIKSNILPKDSFESKYEGKSQAIICHCRNTEEGIKIATDYSLPFIHIKVCNNNEEEYIWNKFLNSFNVAQILVHKILSSEPKLRPLHNFFRGIPSKRFHKFHEKIKNL